MAKLQGKSCRPRLPVPLVIGYVLGLVGWLLRVGMWHAWAREWVGLAPEREEAQGWRRYFSFATHHKVIGVQYLVTFMLVFLLAGALAMVLRAQLLNPAGSLLGPARYNEGMSLHGFLMIAVAVAVVIGGLGNFVVPLMIGAEDMAFPRLNAMSARRGRPRHVGVGLGQQGGDEHLSRALAADLVDGEGELLALRLFGDYPEHRRTPSRRRSAGSLSSSGKVRHVHHQVPDPQLLFIPRGTPAQDL